MVLNLIILTTVLSAAVHANTPNTAPSSELPNVQHIIYLRAYKNPVNPWSTHQTTSNSDYILTDGSPLHQQQMGGVVESNRDQQALQGRMAVVDAVNVQQPQSSAAHAPATVSSNPMNDGKMIHNPGNFIPFYEDQVTILPQWGARDSDEEQEVWPPVGIYPPPPPPPLAIKPPYYPAYYPIQYPVTKPTLRPTLRPTTTRPTTTRPTTRRPTTTRPTTTRPTTTRPTTTRPTTTRPTTTRPTTARPRPPKYPSLYPEPPYYPQYPLEEFPHLPHYPLLPRPTTQRPPNITTTTTTTTTPRPGGAAVEVLENYQIISDKGIRVYKLRLSNGLTDFKKITKKHIGNNTIYVQTGYYSVPVDPERNKYNLIHYIADERGYRIRGVQTCSNENPCRVLKE